MNTSLSKGGSEGSPYSARVSYSARPDRRGLYGKNPVAKMRMARGIKMLAETRRIVEFNVLVPAPSRRRAMSDDFATWFKGFGFVRS